MNRLGFVGTIFFSATISCLSISAAGQVNAAEVALITSQSLPIYSEAVAGIRSIYDGSIREYDLNGNMDVSGRIASEIKRHHPDVIITVGLLASVVARDNFQRTPIVFCMVHNPDRFSIYGNNITGVSLNINSIDALRRLRELFPELKRIGIIYDPVKSSRTVDMEMQAAQTMGFNLITKEVSSVKELPDAFRAIQGQIDLLWLIPDSTVVTPESLEYIFVKSFENRIPVIAFSRELLKRGAAVTFSPDYRSVGAEAARMAKHILSGASPASMRIGSVKSIHTSVNLMVANKMGIEIDRKAMYSLRDEIEIFSPPVKAGINDDN